MQFEFGSGDYKYPFLSFGIGGVYQKDKVFANKGNSNVIWLFNMGYKHDMHINLDLENKVFNGSRADESERSCGTMYLAFGYKKFSNFFFLFHLEEYENISNSRNNENFEYSYYHLITFYHLQYYGDQYGLSVGYTFNVKRYDKSMYNDSETVPLDSTKLDYRKSHGGGLTFYGNNSDSSAGLSGEFHLLADKDMNWMTISEIGVKAYF